MDNAAFDEGQRDELVKVLTRVRLQVDEERIHENEKSSVFDSNGNKIGHWIVKTRAA
jgi:hypothetical protein